MIDLVDKIRSNEEPPRWLYRCKCNQCGQDRGYKRRSEADRLCRRCNGVVTHTGKIVSDETKQKMSKNQFLRRGGIHPLLGKHHSAQTKARLSSAASKQNALYRPDFIYKSGQKAIQMRSSWEVKYAQYLDRCGICWKYEPTYMLNNGHIYKADFQLDDGVIIEIKGYFRQDAMLKWDMFCEEYSHLPKRLIRKIDLQQMGII